MAFMFICKLMQLFLMKLQLGRQTVIIRRIKFRCFISTLPIVIRVQERNRGYYMAAQRYINCKLMLKFRAKIKE